MLELQQLKTNNLADIQDTPELLAKIQIKELGVFSLKGVEQRQKLLQMLPLSLTNRTFPEIVGTGAEAAKLLADLKKMKEESDSVLNEMAKMKEALTSAQDRYLFAQLLVTGDLE